MVTGAWGDHHHDSKKEDIHGKKKQCVWVGSVHTFCVTGCVRASLVVDWGGRWKRKNGDKEARRRTLNSRPNRGLESIYTIWMKSGRVVTLPGLHIPGAGPSTSSEYLPITSTAAETVFLPLPACLQTADAHLTERLL